MAYVGFDDNGYNYFNDGNYVLFSSDNSHNYLFDFISRDLSDLLKLSEKYISNRMDTKTFDLKNPQDDEENLEQIIELLKSIHPYYEYEYRDAIINEIGRYFNNLLIYNHTKHTINFDITKDWYIERITHLTASPLLPSEIREDEFYRKYQNWMGETDGDSKRFNMEPMEETLVTGISRCPKIFSDEISMQRAVSNMLYFILDILAPDISTLTTSQRIWLFSNIFHSQSTFDVKKRLSFYYPNVYENLTSNNKEEYVQDKDYNLKMYDMFEPLYSFSSLNIERDGIPENLNETFQLAVEHAKKIRIKKNYEQYEVSSLEQLLYLEVFLMVQDETMIRKCNNCGKYFVVSNRKIAYCDRKDESGNLCSAVGKKRAFQKKMENEEELKIYNRAYKTRHARLKSGKMSIQQLDEWRDTAKKKLEMVRNGELDISVFQEWLKK